MRANEEFVIVTKCDDELCVYSFTLVTAIIYDHVLYNEV